MGAGPVYVQRRPRYARPEPRHPCRCGGRIRLLRPLFSKPSRSPKGLAAPFRVAAAFLALFLIAGCTNTLLRSEEHTSELQSLMRISYAVFCLKKTTHQPTTYDVYTNDGRRDSGTI